MADGELAEVEASRGGAAIATAIATTGLTKRFASVAAVDSVDLAVPTGSVYGFLGPNGSGKTTTIRMLLGLVFPTAGTHQLLGRDFATGGAAALHRVGALVEGPAFHPYLSGRANLIRVDAADRSADARTVGARVDAALDRVGLGPAAGKRYRAYSLGMRQRLGIAAALLRPRDLLVLDEPTNGLDPQGTREVRTLIGELARDGVTVFLSSHLLSEVEQLCTEIGVMSAGRLVWQGPLVRLRERQAQRVHVETTEPAAAARLLRSLGLAEVTDGEAGVSALLGAAAPEEVVAALVRAGVGVRGFVVARPSLEDQFVGLTGDGFDVSG
ncbi:ABC transporter ATP-binding protein [uncultured Jatrophihabitans sp.]|uniref:ABC transporter ATP-binding protein n=1 Tax=uncultured Jatrophihabitans sp. TaxID=1610747 RepID=UPI0035CABE30